MFKTQAEMEAVPVTKGYDQTENPESEEGF